MSHQLPLAVVSRLATFVGGLDEGLQEQGHKIMTAVEVDDAFDQGWLISDMTRAFVGDLADKLTGDGLGIRDLVRGGRELTHSCEAVRRLFRVKFATRNRAGDLIVYASSDSVLSKPLPVPDPTLFDELEPKPECLFPDEQWVLALELDKPTLSLSAATAARAIGFTTGAPGRLILADLTSIPFSSPSGGGGGFKSGPNDHPLPGEDGWEDGEEGVG